MVLVVGEAAAVDDVVDELGGDAGAASRFGDVNVMPMGAGEFQALSALTFSAARPADAAAFVRKMAARPGRPPS